MGSRILLVEDEADLSLIVADTLIGQGYDVVTAIDGLDGLRKFRAQGRSEEHTSELQSQR